MDTTPDNLSFEPLSEAFAADPYAAYARLRTSAGPVYFEPLDAWLLTRFEDVAFAASNPTFVRSLEPFMPAEHIAAQRKLANWHDMPNHEALIQRSMLEIDGEDHRRLRLIVFQEFTKTFVAKHRAMIQAYVSELIELALEQGEIDFISRIAEAFPGRIIGNLLGVPANDCDMLRQWSEDIVAFFDADRSDEKKIVAERATTEFYDYLRVMIREREAAPREDLLSVMVAAKNAGRMDDAELASMAILILAAGHGSTIDVLGTGMLALLQYPDQQALLRREPEHIRSAVQEMFRYESPLPFFHRYASEDTNAFGRRFAKGTKFGLLYGAANRDPAEFADPDQFNILRSPNRHVAFGRGAHLCLGNHLSRLDMEVLFLELLRRTTHIEWLESAPSYRAGLSSRGLTSLRMRLTAA
ncbi:MAG: cytochrome P450 [Pseudomonadaceae bacterium]|nr:cytochrome P450 [Pseudomonadaceae bacterium]